MIDTDNVYKHVQFNPSVRHAYPRGRNGDTIDVVFCDALDKQCVIPSKSLIIIAERVKYCNGKG